MSRITDFLTSCLEKVICSGPSNRFFSNMRWKFYRNSLRQCSGLFTSFTGLWITNPKNVSIGSGVSLNTHVFVGAGEQGEIEIGNNCLIGPYVVIRAEDHRFDSLEKPIREQGHKSGKIVIEDDCWICAHVTITKDVTIGKGSVIGANSVVTRNIPAYSVAAGNPAKVLRSRLLQISPDPNHSPSPADL